MKSMKGIFLTEVLIFLFLFSFFFLVLMRFIANTIVVLTNINKKSDYIATITSSFDWLIRDVQTIDNFSGKIIIEDGKVLKMNCDSQRITWKLNQMQLVRIFQSYDDSLHQWKKPYTSLVAYPISDLSFDIVYDKKTKSKIQGLICTFSARIVEKESCQFQQTIVLRNGVI